MNPPSIERRVSDLEDRMDRHERDDASAHASQTAALSALKEGMGRADAARAAVIEMVEGIKDRLDRVEWRVGWIVGAAVAFGTAIVNIALRVWWPK